MIKRQGLKLVATTCPIPHDPRSSAVWQSVGRRLRQRRTECGCSIEQVAEWAGITAEACAAYETGAAIPALVLAQIAELLDSPVSWFFEEVAQQQSAESDDNAPEPAVYRVATTEDRIAALAAAFRQLDFEGQQHLLAISRALVHANAAVAAK